MKDVARFHDPQFDSAVAEAHDFMAGTLGLDVTTPDKMAVVPYYNKQALATAIGRRASDIDMGEYLPKSRELYVIADGVTIPLLRELLVHELGHDYTLSTRRARAAHPFIKESLAGMAEAKYRDELLRQGRRQEFDGTLVIDGVARNMPDRYFCLYQNRKALPSQGAMAAYALSLVSEISGITEDEIWAAVPGWRARHIGLIKQSLVALDPEAVRKLERVPRTVEGVYHVAMQLVRCFPALV